MSAIFCAFRMLTKQECHILNNCHDGYVGYGVSPVDSSDGIISGRPYGGVGFLWKRSLDQYITILMIVIIGCAA